MTGIGCRSNHEICEEALVQSAPSDGEVLEKTAAVFSRSHRTWHPSQPLSCYCERCENCERKTVKSIARWTRRSMQQSSEAARNYRLYAVKSLSELSVSSSAHRRIGSDVAGVADLLAIACITHCQHINEDESSCAANPTSARALIRHDGRGCIRSVMVGCRRA